MPSPLSRPLWPRSPARPASRRVRPARNCGERQGVIRRLQNHCFNAWLRHQGLRQVRYVGTVDDVLWLVETGAPHADDVRRGRDASEAGAARHGRRCPLRAVARRARSTPSRGARSPRRYGVTTTVSSSSPSSAPSSARARNTYVPGSANVARASYRPPSGTAGGCQRAAQGSWPSGACLPTA